MYINEADSAVPIISLATHGGVTQLVEYPVHTRLVTCSSQVAATRPVGQAVKTPPFHGGNMGSIPVRVTKKRRHLLGVFFFCPYGNRKIKFHSPRFVKDGIIGWIYIAYLPPIY